MNSVFKFDKELCTACGACMLACIDQNDNDFEDSEIYRRVLTKEDGKDTEYYSLGCIHCEEAGCLENCPKDCFTRYDEFVLLDNSNCIGCRKCSKSCEFDSINFGKDGRANKCNGCVERIKSGFAAPCIKSCPTGALNINI